MTPIEKLIKGLDELGVEYDTYDLPNGEHGLSWIDGNDIEWEVIQQGENFRIHALQLVTPEQAIAATVGVGTCHCTTPDDAWCFSCSSCGKSFPRNELNMAHNHGEINYCPNCGARVENGKDNGMGQE